MCTGVSGEPGITTHTSPDRGDSRFQCLSVFPVSVCIDTFVILFITKAILKEARVFASLGKQRSALILICHSHHIFQQLHFVANCVRSEKGILYNPRLCSRLIGDNPRPIDRA